MGYCGAKSPRGWLCILKEGHEGAHLSLDNQRVWKGTPGFPIMWGERPKTEDDFPRDPTSEELDPLSLSTPSRPGTTGIPCDNCQGLNTIRTGTCLTCLDCNHAGGCG